VAKKTSYIIIALLLAGAVSWYMFSGRISDDGNRIDEIRADISAIADQQQAAIDRLGTIGNGLSDSAAEAGRISEGLGDTTGTIAGVEDRISASQERVSDSQQLIREGIGILQTVRSREQTP